MFARLWASWGRYFSHILYLCFSLPLLAAYFASGVAPTSFLGWLMSLMALAFPFLWLGQLFWVCWFWWRRALLRWFSLGLMLLTTGTMGGYIQLRFGVAEREQWRALTWNVHYFSYLHLQSPKTIGKEKNLQLVLEAIKAQKADLVFLQEFTGARGDLTARAHDYMTNTLGYAYHYSGGQSSLAIYSHFPLRNGRTIDFENSYNSALSAEVLINGRWLRLYNVHLQSVRLGSDAEHILERSDLSAEQRAAVRAKYGRVAHKLRRAFELRAEQARWLAAEIEKCSLPVLLAGDLNDTPASFASMRLYRLLNDSFRDAGTGTGSTYAGALPWLRIDYQFSSLPLRCAWHSVVHSVRHSDHYPVLCGWTWE